MLWGAMDPGHPAYDPERRPSLRPRRARRCTSSSTRWSARRSRGCRPDTTLVVMSDHGFTSWRRAFHLNSWLRDQGYLALAIPIGRTTRAISATWTGHARRAYGLGLERVLPEPRRAGAGGRVPEAGRDALLDELSARLLRIVDPGFGPAGHHQGVPRRPGPSRSADHPEADPDLLVGYAKGFALLERVGARRDASRGHRRQHQPVDGDHCMDHEAVPGLLLTNRPLGRPADSLEALAGSLLAEFGVRAVAAK
jgi:hypothetical protein